MAFSRIVANVEVTNPVASIQLGSAYGSARAATTTILPISSVSAIHIVKQVDLDIRGLDPVVFEIFVTADTTLLHSKKGVTEDLGIADAVFKIFSKKGILDFPTVAEQHAFDLRSSFSESIDVTDDFFGQANPDDDQTMLFSKSLPKEHQYVTDSDDLLVGKNIVDPLTASDGSIFVEDYVEQGYMVPGYVAGVFIPQIDFFKELDEPVTTDDVLSYAMLFERKFSNANVTDDFDGDITSEDDQTMRFAKGLSDLARSAIIVNRDTIKALSDSSTASETLAHLTGKKLSDISSFSDIISAYNVKRLDDVFTTSDGIEKFDIEKLLNDTADATDDFDGVATAEDDQTMSFVTGRTETFPVDDSASLAAGKNLTESVSTSDSGSLRKTDYCDVLYFADVYVGTSATF